jgi:hypothetical protein
MDRITQQSPRQRGYGSTSSLRNDSLKHTRKHEKGREESNQEAKLTGSADRPARWGGPSALASRTVRPDAANRSRQPCRLSGPTPRTIPSVKAHRTNRSNLRKTDRPRGARGPSAKHPRTVRPLLRTVRNFVQPKLKITTDRNERRARTRRAPDEQDPRGPFADPRRTVRPLRTEQKKARPRRSTPPNHHRISQMVEAVATRVWGLEKRHTWMLKPKNLAS